MSNLRKDSILIFLEISELKKGGSLAPLFYIWTNEKETKTKSLKLDASIEYLTGLVEWLKTVKSMEVKNGRY